MLEKATALFRTDPKIHALSAQLRFRAVNRYLVNTEGTVTRKGYTVYFMNFSGSTQADDGMRLERSPYYSASTLQDMPTAEVFQADAVKTMATLKALREAPVVDDEYRGPVLFSNRCRERRFLQYDRRERAGKKTKAG